MKVFHNPSISIIRVAKSVNIYEIAYCVVGILMKLCTLLYGFFFNVAAIAQSPEADFFIPADVCISENFIIQNTSGNSTSYFWDFCTNDFLDTQAPNTFSLGDFTENNISDIEILESEGGYFGFAVSLGTDKIFQINFGEDPNNIPSIVDLGNLVGVLNRPYSIEITEENGEWFGLVNNLGDNKLHLFSFGSDLRNPSANLVRVVPMPTGIALSNPRGLDLVVSEGNYFLFITNVGSRNVSVLDFGASLLNNPTGVNINLGVTGGWGVSIIRDMEQWIAFISANTLYQIDLGDDLNTLTPVVTPLSLDIGVSNATHLDVIKNGENYYLLSGSRSGNIIRFDLGSDLSTKTASVYNYGNLTIFSDLIAINTFKENSTISSYGISYNRRTLHRISYLDNCNAAVKASDETSPVLNYGESGTYPITLTAFNDSGNIDDTTQFITVTDDQAPTIDFQLSSQCMGSMSTLTATADQILTSGSWIIYGDTLSGESIPYDFSIPSTYEVTLEVEAAGSCGNRLTKEITIYESPSPNFSIPVGQICTNGVVSFTNTTDAKGADSLIIYQWFLDGELVSEAASPDIIFTEGGTKTLQLAASIPGCTETFEQTIDVLQGPTVGFTLPPQLCEGETITLENETSGDNITNYQWSFGDGGTLETTTAEVVSYTFAEAGTYNISLTANTSLGCANVSTQTVTVYEKPTVGFTSDVACVGAITQFTDTSSAGSNANIIAWDWDFGDGVGLADERNPTYTFAAPGTYTVELTTHSSGGCIATATQTIMVETSVTTAFATVRACPTDTDPYLYQFTDESTVVEGETITQRLWSINGENFVDKAVTYAFTEPGTYEVSLTAFASSGCNATFSQSVTVDLLPEIRFQAASGCVGKAIQLTNASQLNGWELTQFTWEIPEVGLVFQESPTVVFPEAGDYSLILSLETENGCTFSWDSTISILAAPQAIFEIDQLTGGAPFTVQPTNLSIGYTSARWSINGSQVSEAIAPTFTLEELGAYVIELIVQNDIGCADTTRQTVEVVNPSVDLSVVELVRIANGTSSDQLVLTLENRGTVTIDTVEIQLSLGNVVSLQEQILEPILQGERRTYPLQTTLGDVRNQQTPVEFICATVNAVTQPVSETDINDNRACIALTAPVLVEAPFPNPTHEELVLSVVLEEPETIQVDIISASGERIHSEQIPDTQSGLNTIRVNVSQTPAGVYTLEIRVLGQTITHRVIVNP